MARLPLVLGAALALAACSPAIDWREMAPPELGVRVSFPCRPASHEREVELAGQRTRMVLYACRAADATFGLAAADVGDVRLVGRALDELSAAAARNVAATPGPGEDLRVPGMTPNEHARRFDWSGALPDGAATREHLAVFARGTRVFQATVLGPRPDPEMVRTFFDSVRFGA